MNRIIEKIKKILKTLQDWKPLPFLTVIIFILIIIVILLFNIHAMVKEMKDSQLRSEHFIENTGKYVDVVEGRKLIDPQEYIKRVRGE